MKKAVILTGGHQYLVSEGEELEVEKLGNVKPSSETSRPVVATTDDKTARNSNAGKKIEFEPLLVIDGENISIGAPIVSGVKVTADVVEAEVKTNKVIAIRFKAKKRVDTRRGHRQKLTRIKITKIASATAKK